MSILAFCITFFDLLFYPLVLWYLIFMQRSDSIDLSFYLFQVHFFLEITLKFISRILILFSLLNLKQGSLELILREPIIILLSNISDVLDILLLRRHYINFYRVLVAINSSNYYLKNKIITPSSTSDNLDG